LNDITLALIGGGLIGLSATLWLLLHGRVAGISGILGGFLKAPRAEGGLRGWFLLGLVLAGVIGVLVAPAKFAEAPVSLPVVAVAGLLVGFGTRLGNGCTSGHGICGMSRLSPRSLAAVFTFMAAGAAVVFLARHILGGTP
jgi:uncharacterized membrane protein YedE/YeeE